MPVILRRPDTGEIPCWWIRSFHINPVIHPVIHGSGHSTFTNPVIPHQSGHSSGSGHSTSTGTKFAGPGSSRARISDRPASNVMRPGSRRPACAWKDPSQEHANTIPAPGEARRRCAGPGRQRPPWRRDPAANSLSGSAARNEPTGQMARRWLFMPLAAAGHAGARIFLESAESPALTADSADSDSESRISGLSRTNPGDP